jgi:hypothetical protein
MANSNPARRGGALEASEVNSSKQNQGKTRAAPSIFRNANRFGTRQLSSRQIYFRSRGIKGMAPGFEFVREFLMKHPRDDTPNSRSNSLKT